MKTKTNIFWVCVLCLCILTTLNSKAQQPQNVVKPNTATIITVENGVINNYTYSVFQAPNKLYGYDIFKNGKGVFHQTVPEDTSDQSALTKKEYAEKAAILSIDKLKTKINATLTPQEVKKIISQ